HIPNQREVLGELGRVLRPGGIAGFSEPGRRHSQSPQSQYEMANHKVLENDIDVNAIFALARTAGFTRLSLRVVNDMEISLDEHDVMFGGGSHDALKSGIWNQTYNAMHNRAIFFLHKGELARDSRSHVGLAHRIRIDGVEQAGAVGARTVSVRVSLENTGGATWLHENGGAIFGVVRLGTHLYDGRGDLLAIDHSRHELPQSVAPGETIAMTASVPLPGPTAYRLTFDLVAEGVTWFENLGSRPATVEV
ncbi:MAG TPA: hypothetical protein VFO19_09095, partial [Vicinamibacterales bacterium]|nr:hypothetical protein [Vicinamibacterales bacterium]